MAGAQHFQLVNDQKDEFVPIQRVGENELVFLADAEIKAGEKVSYSLSETNPQLKIADVELEETDEIIKISVAGKPVLQYNKSVVMPPEGSPEYYRRSGFIHPLYSPSGKVMTDGFPEGHTHQHAVFMAWVNTTFRDTFTDFWNQQKVTGGVIHTEVEQTVNGPVFAEFQTRLRHFAFQTDDSIPALDEVWTVRVYNSADPFIIDLKSVQQCAGEDTLFINKYHYGGFGIRGSAEWNDLEFRQPDVAEEVVNYIGREGKGGFFTSEGLTRVPANHTRPYWVDFHGTVEGQEAGILTMGSKENFRFPQPIRIHPTMPYFCFAPMVEGAFTIAPGDVYTSAYRLVVYDGGVNFEKNKLLWEAYRDGDLPL